jgi:hypothetical protein
MQQCDQCAKARLQALLAVRVPIGRLLLGAGPTEPDQCAVVLSPNDALCLSSGLPVERRVPFETALAQLRTNMLANVDIAGNGGVLASPDTMVYQGG